MTSRTVDPGDRYLRSMVRSAQAPARVWGPAGAVELREMLYVGEPLRGRSTRVFAYVSLPAGARGPLPAVVLVHGGGGRAFAEWAAHWAGRGYVAIAMDLAGHGSGHARLADGGPDQDDAEKFRPFSDDEAHDMWSYHAVGAVIRAISVLATLPQVDQDRIGVVGISWGGYLACIVAGLDHRLKVAVSVYGCGYLAEGSMWKAPWLDPMDPPARDRWTRWFDPAQYVAAVRCPMLFMNGTADPAYPLDSHRKTALLVDPSLRTVSLHNDLPHDHIWTFREVDAFVDAALRNAVALTRLSDAHLDGQEIVASVVSGAPPVRAEIVATTDGGPWATRVWTSAPARIRDREVRATLPASRSGVAIVSVRDERGLRTSTLPVEWPGP